MEPFCIHYLIYYSLFFNVQNVVFLSLQAISSNSAQLWKPKISLTKVSEGYIWLY